ncbi:hypothetical protein Tco_1245377, partial [Tanacetum coccineum]
VFIGGGVLNLPLSKARISLGDFVRRLRAASILETLNELRVGDSVHESGDSQAI